MNVIKATLNKKSSRGRGRGRFKNAPVFNTYIQRKSGEQTSSKKSFASSSSFSAIQSRSADPIASNAVLARADRNSTSTPSMEPVFRTPSVTTSFQNRPINKDPQINNDFLTEFLRTPDAPSTRENSKTSSIPRQIIRCLPPPSFGVKQRSSTGSGARPLSTPSHSRTPRTPGTTPKTISSLESANHMTVAMTEGRGLARGEVGIAAVDISRPHLYLCQISDTQTYINTLSKINIINPVEILVPNTFVESQTENKLFTLLQENFPHASITTVQRRHFSDSVGLQQVQSLGLPEYSNVELVVSHKFYALAAAAALLKFIEFMKNIIFTPKSLKIEYQSPENVMAIDINTAQRLELVVSRGGGDERSSLLGILDHCSTASGKRALRANILQPPTRLTTINSRLLSVTELAQSPALLHSLQTAVAKFLDVEQLMWLCVQVPNFKDEQKASEMQTNYVLLLKTTLDSLPMLVESLQSAQTPYFHKVLKDLEDERFGLLLTTILEVVNEDARTKKGYSASQFQRCFAIKVGVNGLLDMARNTYSQLISTTQDKVQELAQEHNLPLRWSTTGNKGVHIQLSVTRAFNFSAKDLPDVFIQVARTRNLITCTTEDMVVLNHRLKEVILEIQLMSNMVMQELLRKLRTHVGCLYRLCENIAELDLLVAFAQVSSADNFVPPTFGNLLDLTNSRHPILDFINASTPVANNVFASPEKNFHIITGPNMGGKSIYIKQVALLQVMAQIGCFVPAESAKFKIIKQIFSRLGFDDSIEYNASSFVFEMQEMQYILRHVGPHSLVVVDELCRSTDYEEGTALAWVLCEQLLQTKAFTFFTTHYLCLSKLQYLYPNVVNHQMIAEENNEGRLSYTHKLAPGVTKIMLYGLRLAQMSSLPQAVLQRAKEICEELSQNRLAEPVYNEEKTEAEEDQEYVQELVLLIRSNKLNIGDVREVQSKLKQRYGIEDVLENKPVNGTEQESKESEPEEDPDISSNNVAVLVASKQMVSSAGVGISFDTSEVKNSFEEAQPTRILHTSQNSSHVNMQEANQRTTQSIPASQISPQATVICNNPREVAIVESSKTHMEMRTSSCVMEVSQGIHSQSTVVRQELRTPTSGKQTANYTFHSLGSKEIPPPNINCAGTPRTNMSGIFQSLSRTSTPKERNESQFGSPLQIQSNMLVDERRNSPWKTRGEVVFPNRNDGCQSRDCSRVNIQTSPFLEYEIRNTPVETSIHYQSENEGELCAMRASVPSVGNNFFSRNNSPTFDYVRNSPYCEGEGHSPNFSRCSSEEPMQHFARRSSVEDVQHSTLEEVRSENQSSFYFPRHSEPFGSCTPAGPTRYSPFVSEDPYSNSYSPLEKSPDMFTCPSPVFSEHSRQTFDTNDRMVIGLSPNIERIPRILDFQSDFDEDDLFEE